ncbi:hypothetical protein E4T50_08149 [Aureobasidium sp. EXF-12298]|nr:hypothetical protein E4T50_08149 [Aureobasidium sp. EXF-12298]
MKNTLLLASGFAVAYAADSRYGNIFGSSNDTALMNANQHPNISKSVPFQMGDKNFTFRVNVAEYIPDWNTTVQNPRVTTSFYELEWSGDTSLNDTIAAMESLSDNQSPRFCASIPIGLLSVSVNNDYDEKDDGDCTGALGKDCVNDLKQMGYDQGVSCSPDIPKSCDFRLETGGIGSAPLAAQGETQTSPFNFFHWSSLVYTVGNNETYIRETERLHVVIFSGKDTYPVCLRVKDDHVSKSSPATSGAAAISSRDMTWKMLMAVAIAFWLA